VTTVSSYHDEALPQLPTGGLWRWMGARGELHHLTQRIGDHKHFYYASSGPSLGQWLVAHGAGGQLVAGAARLGLGLVCGPNHRSGSARHGARAVSARAQSATTRPVKLSQWAKRR